MPDYSSLRRSLAHYWSMDNGSYPYTQFDRMRTCNLRVYTLPTIQGGLAVPGKLGKGLNLSTRTFGAFQEPTTPFFSSNPEAVTFSIWVKMDDVSGTVNLLLDQLLLPSKGSIALRYIGASGLFRFSIQDPAPLPIPPAPVISVDNAYAATDGEWIHALAFYDLAGHRIGLRINNNTTAWTYSDSIESEVAGYSMYFAPLLDGVLDDTAIWTRLLKDNEQDWLYNGGAGLGYDDFKVVAATSECQEIPCCDSDPYTYSAVAATASGSATGSDCAQVPFVTIEPPESSQIAFPTYIILSASMSGSVIRYTTDGTDPTEDSTVYTIPFQIYGPTTNVKSRAWLGDCVGPIAAARYTRTSEFDLTFYNVCPPIAPLRAGTWGVWDGSEGGANYGWILGFTLTDALHVWAFEIYETNSVGEWNTGQAWSTQEYIDPPNGTPNFHVYPLVLDEGGQINAAYTDDFGTTYGHFGVGAHTLSAFGHVQIDVPGVTYFRLRMFLEAGTVLERIIASDTCDPPPCDEYPPDPTVTPSCSDITVSFTTTAALPYQIWRWASNDGTQIMVASGTTTAGPDSFVDSAVVEDVLYCYSLRVQYTGCPHYTSSGDVCGNISAQAYLTVTPDVTLIDGSSGTVTFTINSQSLAAGGACADALVHYSYTDGSGPHSGTVPGNSAQTLPLVLQRPAAAPYSVTVTFAGCNSCNAPSVALVVTFTTPPCCAVTPATVLVDVATFDAAVQAATGACATSLCIYGISATGFPTSWNGSMVWQGSCLYYAPQTDLTLCTFQCESGVILLGYVYAAINFAGACNVPGSYWGLGITLIKGENELVLWNGVKYSGDSPLGTYVKIAGPDSGCVVLASLTVA